MCEHKRLSTHNASNAKIHYCLDCKKYVKYLVLESIGFHWVDKLV